MLEDNLALSLQDTAETYFGQQRKATPCQVCLKQQAGAGLYSQGGAACTHSPPLVQVDQEHHVISETGQPVRRGHGDDEGKDIINEGVKSL